MTVSDRTVIQISRPIYRQLVELKREREQAYGRQVTYTEIIEMLLAEREAAMK